MSMTKEETDAILAFLQDGSEALEVALVRLDNIATRLLKTRGDISKRVSENASFDDLVEVEREYYNEFSQTLGFSFERILSLIEISNRVTTTYINLIESHNLMENLKSEL